MLYLVSTPIGNLKDITLRALEVLSSADIIVCEDTRRLRKLLAHYKIKPKRIVVLNNYNERKKSKAVVDELKTKDVVLVSDAGTPLVNDPGFFLVRQAVENNIKVVPVPGASSLLASLVSSGLPMDRFAFMGFFPKQKKRRKEILLAAKQVFNSAQIRTYIFFESPYRVLKTVGCIRETIPEAKLCICRELTKRFEEFYYSAAADINTGNINPKGEFVIIISFDKGGKDSY